MDRLESLDKNSITTTRSPSELKICRAYFFLYLDRHTGIPAWFLKSDLHTPIYIYTSIVTTVRCDLVIFTIPQGNSINEIFYQLRDNKQSLPTHTLATIHAKNPAKQSRQLPKNQATKKPVQHTSLLTSSRNTIRITDKRSPSPPLGKNCVKAGNPRRPAAAARSQPARDAHFVRYPEYTERKRKKKKKTARAHFRGLTGLSGRPRRPPRLASRRGARTPARERARAFY